MPRRRHPPANSPLPSSPCDIPGCSARAQRQWAEPDGSRKCIGHARAPEALRLQRKAADTGRGVASSGEKLPDDDPDGSEGLLEHRAALANAPALLEKRHETFGELLDTDSGRKYLRAWLFQSVCLKTLAPDATSSARQILRDIEDLAAKGKKDGWEDSPLFQGLLKALGASEDVGPT